MIEDEFLPECGYCKTAITNIFDGSEKMRAMCKLHRAFLYWHVRLIETKRNDDRDPFLSDMLSLPLGRQTASWEEIERRIRGYWTYGGELF